MEVTAEDYWRLQPLYPEKDYKRDGETLRMTIQRQKKDMKLHLAREKGYGDIKPLWFAILECKRAGFSLRDAASILQTDIEIIINEWERMRQNAR